MENHENGRDLFRVWMWECMWRDPPLSAISTLERGAMILSKFDVLKM